MVSERESGQEGGSVLELELASEEIQVVGLEVLDSGLTIDHHRDLRSWPVQHYTIPQWCTHLAH